MGNGQAQPNGFMMNLMGFQQNLTDVPPALMLDGAQKGKKSSIQPIEKAYTVAKLKSTHKIRHWGSEQWQRLRRFVRLKIPLPSIYCRLKLSAHLRRWNILSQDSATFQTKPITTCIETRTEIPLSCHPADRWVAEKLFDSRSGSSSTRDSKWCYPANYDSKKSMCIMNWLIPTWDLFRKFDSYSGTPTEAYSAYLIHPPEHQLRLVPQIWLSSRRTPNSGLFRKLDSTGDTTVGSDPQLSLIPRIFAC